jgi:predicted glycosyltransferase
MINKLSKHHEILCTSRNYREVVELSKIKNINLRLIGKHGGSTKEGKIRSSIQRMNHLLDVITKFSPDFTVSFCSPEAARISYGIGIKHVAFSDSPHAQAVMRLSVPLVQKLLIPWVIPKNKFIKYGIAKKDIVQYKSIDAAVIVKEKSRIEYVEVDKNKKTIVIRPEESEAAYILGKTESDRIIHEVSKESESYNIIVLARYISQKNRLKEKFGKNVMVMDKVVDGKSLLNSTDLFIGSGGTMTAESALMGVPTISYDAVPNYIEKYLVRVGLVKRETNPKQICILIKKMLKNNKENREKAKKKLASMEDPYFKLIQVIKTIQPSKKKIHSMR